MYKDVVYALCFALTKHTHTNECMPNETRSSSWKVLQHLVHFSRWIVHTHVVPLDLSYGEREKRDEEILWKSRTCDFNRLNKHIEREFVTFSDLLGWIFFAFESSNWIWLNLKSCWKSSVQTRNCVNGKEEKRRRKSALEMEISLRKWRFLFVAGTWIDERKSKFNQICANFVLHIRYFLGYRIIFTLSSLCPISLS